MFYFIANEELIFLKRTGYIITVDIANRCYLQV